MRLSHKTDYRRHRIGSYPVMGDAVDAIMKGFRALIDQGIKLPPETVSWVEACEAVKQMYKKDKQ